MKPSRHAIAWLGALLLFFAVVVAKEKKEQVPAAKISVEGLGWIQNRETRLAISRLWGEKPGSELNTNQIEDAALFIASNLSPRGYQRPRILVEAVLADGAVQRFEVDTTLQTTPPPWLRAKEVHFNVDRGVQSYLSDIVIEGLTVIKPAAAREFFFTEVALIGGRSARAFSPARVQRSAEAIESTLRQRGYAEAVVKVVDTKEDEKTGAVVAKINVKEGPRWDLAELDFDVRGPETPELTAMRSRKGIVWSTFRGQDLAEEIRHTYYQKGYPDVRVRVEAIPGEPVDNARPIKVVAHVNPGPQVGVGQVRFTGQQRTRESVLRRRVQIAPGDPLNPLAIDKARYRLGRLGIFHSVDVAYQPPDGPVRDPVFELSEEKPLEVNLMGGYGSYEQLRGGVEVTQRNVFGRAHQSRLQLVQSMKSSRGDYTYSVPEIFGETVDGSLKLFGLQRQERAFLRQEFGATMTLRRNFASIHSDGTLGYTFQSLRASENELATRNIDNQQLNVGSVDATLTHDGRDNPLRPRRGYRWYVQAESASQLLGGQVNYQRIELGASYHTSWGHGRWVHAGMSHGFVTTVGSTDRLLPVNKRFYPGGESSIRGFPEGEAAPREADGRFVGAKSFLLLNAEIEQGLTKSWSVVLFTDALGETATLKGYPFDTELVSVGLGLRYQTLIGPIRLEYGHNVVKRTEDPRGALQISVGFPF